MSAKKYIRQPSTHNNCIHASIVVRYFYCFVYLFANLLSSPVWITYHWPDQTISGGYYERGMFVVSQIPWPNCPCPFCYVLTTTILQLLNPSYTKKPWYSPASQGHMLGLEFFHFRKWTARHTHECEAGF